MTVTTSQTQPTLPISVFIITLNEQAHLAKTLESVRCCEEIIVVDSGSTDNTVEIAKQYGAKVFFNPWPGYAEQKQIALNHCQCDWVLNLDGDEEMTPQALAACERIMAHPSASALRFSRLDQFIGQFPGRWVKPANNVRFYKRQHAAFDTQTKVHESAHITGEEVRTRAHFLHYGYNDIATLVDKTNQYSSLKAQEKYAKNKRASLVKLLFIFPAALIKSYVFQRRFLFGLRGVILALIEANYAFLKEAKLYELGQTGHDTNHESKH